MGDVLESDQLAMSALAIDPTDLEAVNIAARCAIATRGRTRTEAAIRQMLSLAPDDGFVLSEVGKMLFEIGRRASGMAVLRSVLRADPTNHRLHLTLGYAYIARGDWVDARRHFREALRIKPELEQIRRLLRMGNKTLPPKMPEGWTIVRWIEKWDEEGKTQRHLIE